MTPNGHWPSVRPHFPTSGKSGYSAALVLAKSALGLLAWTYNAVNWIYKAILQAS
jgi:hypothetical protein